MLDVDYFKNYNDNNGHVEGDKALIKVSELLKEHCRNIDFVCRYGGEEFSIILPYTDSNGAFLVAEKLRKVVESTKFDYEQLQPNKLLTISIGLATYPETVNDEFEIKRLADKALYHSKANGRNKVSIYQKGM